MAIKRSELIDSESAGYYHLMSRCVRRTFLCGVDKETGQSYEHRRGWIENRILRLAKFFAIEVYAYSILSNHYHLVIYSDPKLPEQWTDIEVAERWLKAFPGNLEVPKFKHLRPAKLQAIVKDKQLLASYRQRLGSISWLMKQINEPIAKRSNKEDSVTGHFWESRFSSQSLLDETAMLTCMTYVDLNPIRAGISKTLENSEHTSIKQRINKLTEEQLKQSVKSLAGEVQNRTMVINLKDYIELVEWTGKSIIYPRKARMPANIRSSLLELNLQPNNWLTQIGNYGSVYGNFVGKFNLLKQKAKQLQKKWLKGLKPIQELTT